MGYLRVKDNPGVVGLLWTMDLFFSGMGEILEIITEYALHALPPLE